MNEELPLLLPLPAPADCSPASIPVAPTPVATLTTHNPLPRRDNRKRHRDLEGPPIYGVGFAGSPTCPQAVRD
jgi:hypothetical protein